MNTNGSGPSGINLTSNNHFIGDYLTHYLTRGQSVGLTIVAEASLASLLAVLYVFVIISRNVAWRVRNSPTNRWQVFYTPMDLLMFSLFSADLLQAIGGVMNLKWINDGKVQVGDFCSAQGILKQLGETGVAITTLLITLYTFLGIWLGKAIRSMKITRAVLSAAWLCIVLVVITGNAVNRGPNRMPFISPTPYWCWIGQSYIHWRIWGEYFWLWITLGFSIVAYVPLWLWSRGNIILDDHSWWKFTLQHADMDADPVLRGLRRRSLMMLAYPFAYCISTLPLSIVRWIGFVEGPSNISSTATLIVDTMFNLSGTFNVVLLLTTRPDSVLFGKQAHIPLGHALRPVQLALHSEGIQSIRRDDDTELGKLPSRS
ncbi:hypothetical protein GALMADRAFT_137377 [Galerina marginata CBS 339.88]|uniref:Uncharacterized protein n=1 Tax=Galerina marginata (strain CBS 339.88) TaxID=685588 RepID=A0A067TI47_GALM3|nr:hypothetical protein GALMADRAFT_137377 [Galerina marginata CBS 339.88]